MPQGFWINYLFALAVVTAVLAVLFAIARAVGRGRIRLPNIAITSAAAAVASGKYHRRRRERFVTILESTMLSHHASLHVVQAGPRRYLLIGTTAAATTTASSAAGLTTIAELAPDDVAAWLLQTSRNANA